MSFWKRPGSNALALLAIVAVLSVVFSVLVGGLAYYQQSQDRIETHDYVEREAGAIGTYILEATLRNDYQNILSFIDNWGRRHGDITRISIRAPNGFDIASYRRLEPAGIPATERHIALHENQEIVTVELTYDLTNLLDKRRQTRWSLVPYITGFAAILALILWTALRRLVLMPMQHTDARLTTTARELAARNRQLRQALRQADIANRAKSDLMANMSHELRTPLNAIIGFSGTIKEETFGPLGNDKYREYLDDIHHSGRHLLELINDILDVSAIEASALELHEGSVSPSNIVEVAIRLIKPRADNGQVTVTSFIDSEIPNIYVDERRMKQILLNLLSNAVKFTLEGGEVSVNVRLNGDGSLAISVTDSGVGMDEKELTVALSTFGQVDSGLDRKHEGTGLGLPLTKGLINLHDGTLEVQSEKGNGTMITVTLPKERVIQNVY